jgi:hypothetical protein
MKKLILLLGLLIPTLSFARSYTIPWHKVAGGGGTYQVSGTIGQPDASGAMTSSSGGKGMVLVLVTLQ